jgi:hypothetical protein
LGAGLLLSLLRGAAAGDVAFTPFNGEHDVASTYAGDFAIPSANPFGYFGDLSLAAVPENRFPLTVTFITTAHANNDLTAAVPLKTAPWRYRWGDPQYAAYKPGSGRDEGRHVVTVPADERDTPLPVWDTPFGGDAGWNGRQINQLDVDIRDRDGKPVARRTLIEAYEKNAYGRFQSRAITADEPEAERFFQEAGKGTIRMDHLPSPIHAYRGVPAIWVSSSAFNRADAGRFFQRLLLSGVDLTGRVSAVDTCRALVGLPGVESVMGTLMAPANDATRDALRQNSSSMGWDAGADNGALRFVKTTPLGGNRVSELKRFSLIYLGVFVVGASVFLAFALGRSRARRVAVWWWVPALSFAYAGLGLVLAPLAVDFRPAEQIFETIYSFGDWPDAFVETNVGALSMRGETLAWTFAGDTDLSASNDTRSATRPGRRRRRTNTAEIIITPSESRLSMPVNRGALFFAQGRRFLPANKVCAPLSATRWRFADNFDEVWVWTGHDWRTLGAVKAGEERNVMEGQDLTRLPGGAGAAFGLPAHFAGLPPRLRQLANVNITSSPSFRRQGVVIGLQNDQSTTAPRWHRSGEVTRRTIRVHGFFLPEQEIR